MPPVQLKTGEGQDYPSVPSWNEDGKKLSAIVLGHILITSWFLPLENFFPSLPFKALRWPWGLRWCSFRAPLESRLCSGAHKPACPRLLLHCVSPGTASAAVQCINLILGAPFELLLAGKSLCSSVISEALCCSHSFVLFCFTELGLSFAFVFLQ